MIHLLTTFVLIILTLPVGAWAAASSTSVTQTINTGEGVNETTIETSGDAEVFVETYINGELTGEYVSGGDSADTRDESTASIPETDIETTTETEQTVRELVRKILKLIIHLDYSL